MTSFFPERSVEGKAALDVFYVGFNEVNFYVEDEDQENLYFLIFKKLFSNVSFYRIFPLGGKSKVIAHAKASDNSMISGKRVYIVDRDFDGYLNRLEHIKGLFYLERYCIENYLIEEDAIIEVVIESYPKAQRVDVFNNLKLTSAINQMESSLKELFFLFYCAQHFSIEIKNCSSKVEEYCNKSNLWVVESAALSAYRGKLIDLSKAADIQPQLSYDLESDARVNKVLHDNCSLISGKFFLAMIFHYIKRRYPLGSITFESFVYRLAKNCSFNGLSYLRDAVSAYVAEK